jgi:hypothetical protein
MKRAANRTAQLRAANQSAGGPIGARNAVQRVSGHPCAICGGPVVRAARGPAPRACAACGGRVRAVGQLRAYFASAERLARSLDIGSVAALAREAAALIEREASR